MEVFLVDLRSPPLDHFFLKLVQVELHHALLDRTKFGAGTQCFHRIFLKFDRLPLLDAVSHHALEVLDDEILLQATDQCSLQGCLVGLCSELAH